MIRKLNPVLEKILLEMIAPPVLEAPPVTGTRSRSKVKLPRRLPTVTGFEQGIESQSKPIQVVRDISGKIVDFQQEPLPRRFIYSGELSPEEFVKSKINNKQVSEPEVKTAPETTKLKTDTIKSSNRIKFPTSLPKFDSRLLSVPAYMATDFAINMATGVPTYQAIEPGSSSLPAAGASYVVGSGASSVALDAPLGALAARRARDLSMLQGALQGSKAGMLARMTSLPGWAATIIAPLALENETRRMEAVNDSIEKARIARENEKLLDRAQGIQKPDEEYQEGFWEKFWKGIVLPPPIPTGTNF